MKIILPGYDVPMMLQGGVINPIWYERLQALANKVNKLDARGLLDAPDVNNTTPITDGQVLVWDDTDGVFKPGTN